MKNELNFKKDHSTYLGMFLMTLTVIGILFMLFKSFNYALDQWALSNCDVYNDCAEVIKSINK